VFHIGIFAGYGAMWVAPHTGSVVKLQQIWTRNVYFTRVA
jgi:hypothetical protein